MSIQMGMKLAKLKREVVTLTAQTSQLEQEMDALRADVDELKQRRGPGRPPGAKNKPKEEEQSDA